MKILVIIAFFVSELLFAAPAGPRENIKRQIKKTEVTNQIKSDIKKDLVKKRVKNKASQKFAAKKVSLRKAGDKVAASVTKRYDNVVDGDARPQSLGRRIKVLKAL